MARDEQAQEPEVTSADHQAATGITPADRVASTSSLKSLGQASDTEGAERPVREKLKKTSIAGLPRDVLSDDDHEMSAASDVSKEAATEDAAGTPDTNEEPRGRVRKKRSFEDMGGIRAEKQGRKRSRDVTLADAPEITKRKASAENKNGTIKEGSSTPSSSAERTRRGMLSPKGKRNREEFEEEGDKPSAEVKDTNATEKISTKKPSGDEPKVKRHRDSNSPESGKENNTADTKTSETKIPQGSGFANTSAASPFASLAASKSPTPQPQTSDSAFKASGFGALASTSTSPFGALGAVSKPASSPFGSTTATAKPTITGFSGSSTPSAFGGLTSSENKSPFAAATSGFGSIASSGFGSGFGGGGKLTSFGGGSGPKITGLSDKPARPFGAPKDEKEEEEGSGDEAGDEEKEKVLSPTNEEDKKDERFFEQDVETGEENEETIFVCRAKLYNFVKVSDTKKEWKERGLGNLKVNVKKQSAEDAEKKAPKKARFVMRADGSHRVVLNSPIQKELKVGDVKGEKPTNGLVLFMGTMDSDDLEMLQLKVKQQNAEALWDKVSALQQEM
ncbi:Nuclear protein export protein [Lasiodiplodia theobromae]|uniref:Nuclear protein export protein n=1 Tax=Lasiodiplodia theobromae TaxID=45133 RepID=UPI0015C36D0A|nr:Nuclear protein export protein [Lasiodiplodia theobromae]KAF4546799.1 Nuclear protein export protein [Lasiodiplodia theobromae]